MNLIVVGASHHNSSVPTLERLSRVDGPQAFLSPHVGEVVVLTTCNRTDIYAAVPAFHAGLTHIAEVLAQSTGLRQQELASSLYVHHGIDAVIAAPRDGIGPERKL